jgi:hypothetical protein
MSLLNFIIAVLGIVVIHLALAFVYNKISQVFPFVFGGFPAKQDALYKQL